MKRPTHFAKPNTFKKKGMKEHDLKEHDHTLTAEERRELPRSDFAEPEKRKYPIENKAHARNALARVSQYGTPSEKHEVREAVAKKYPDMKIDGYTMRKAKSGEASYRESGYLFNRPHTSEKTALARGAKQEEKEHHLGKKIDTKIASDHLQENPHYYDKTDEGIPLEKEHPFIHYGTATQKDADEMTRYSKEYRFEEKDGKILRFPKSRIKNQRDLQRQYFEGRTNGRSASTSVEGEKIYSYGTVIGVKRGKTFYLNANRYSVTTSKQQNYLRAEARQHGYEVREVKPEQHYGRTDNEWADNPGNI